MLEYWVDVIRVVDLCYGEDVVMVFLDVLVMFLKSLMIVWYYFYVGEVLYVW